MPGLCVHRCLLSAAAVLALALVLAGSVEPAGGDGGAEAISLGSDGSILRWLVCGPFTEPPPELDTDLAFLHDYLADVGGERRCAPAEGDEAYHGGPAWTDLLLPQRGTISFDEIYGRQPAVAYAFCRLHSDRPRELLAKLGSDDGVRVFVDGWPVHSNRVARALTADEDAFVLPVREGATRLLVKVENLGGDWELQMRLCEEDGAPAQGVGSSVELSGGGAEPIAACEVRQTGLWARGSDAGGPLAEVRWCSLAPPGPGRLCVDVEGADGVSVELPTVEPGWRVERVSLPSVVRPTNARVRIEVGGARRSEDVVLHPQKRWEVFLVQHTHTDIGYTAPQSEMAGRHARWIADALECCRRTDDYPERARFKWVCESTWGLMQFLDSAPRRQIDEFVARAEEGRIEVAGMYVNMTELFTQEEFIRSLFPLRRLRERYGIDVVTACQNDVNGFPWALPALGREVGLRYFATGINHTRSVLPFPVPSALTWEGWNGAGILAWSGDVYHRGNRLGLVDDEDAECPELIEYLDDLAERGYPHARVLIQHSGLLMDNAPPSTSICDVVRRWNERWEYPRLRTATFREWFEVVERFPAETVPTHRAAWTDWWADGNASCARETALSRRTHGELEAAEAVLAMAVALDPAGNPYPREALREAYEDLMLFDEHTFGANTSVRRPLGAAAIAQWDYKKAFCRSASMEASRLLSCGLARLGSRIAGSGRPGVVVFNSLAWPRSDVVEVTIDGRVTLGREHVRLIESESGAIVPCAVTPMGRTVVKLSFVAADVPPCGYRTYEIAPSDEPSAGRCGVTVGERTLENAFYRVVLGEDGSIAGIYDVVLGRDLVLSGSGYAMNQLIYETVVSDLGRGLFWPGRGGGRDDFACTSPAACEVSAGEHGPVRGSLVARSSLPGLGEISREVVLWDGLRRVEIRNTLVKEESFDPEAVYFAFPFDVPGGRVRFEVAGGAVYPGVDQVPGSATDWCSVQRWVDVSNSAYGVTWSPREAPLVQFGGINTGLWRPTLDPTETTFVSWAANNYWYTNFPASQRGELFFSYAISSHSGGCDAAAATRFGYEVNTPLRASVLPAHQRGDLPAGSWSFLSVESEGVVATCLKAGDFENVWVLRLRELSGRGVAATVSSPYLFSGASVYAANVLEEESAEVGHDGECLRLSFEPYETKTVIVRAALDR